MVKWFTQTVSESQRVQGVDTNSVQHSPGLTLSSGCSVFRDGHQPATGVPLHTPAVPSLRSLCREVAEEKGLLFTASLTATPIFEKGGSRDDVIAAYRQQLKPIVEEGVSFIMCEVSQNDSRGRSFASVFHISRYC